MISKVNFINMSNKYQELEQIVADNQAFGLHLMVDIANCSPSHLHDINWLNDMLRFVPKKIGMHIITEPCIVKFNGRENKYKCQCVGKCQCTSETTTDDLSHKDPGGLSGYVILAESHFSFHTFPEISYISLDLYSCNTFDVVTILKDLQQRFVVKDADMEVQLVVRGQNYPRNSVI